jgi:hypothetical protein
MEGLVGLIWGRVVGIRWREDEVYVVESDGFEFEVEIEIEFEPKL